MLNRILTLKTISTQIPMPELSEQLALIVYAYGPIRKALADKSGRGAFTGE
jgi:hypothetical protein